MTENHAHPHITGTDGELVDLFIELVDRENPAAGTQWWYDQGMMAFLNFSVMPARDAPREVIIGGLREMIEQVIDAGLDEAFLIESLTRDLDDVMAGRGDTSLTDQAYDDMRAHLLKVIEDPAVRAEWYRGLSRQNPKYAGMSDEELLADAQSSYDRFADRKVSADEAAERWSDAELWRDLRARLLPPVIFKHWRRLNNQRALEAEQRGDL